MSRNSFPKTGAKSEVSVTATGFQPTTTYFVDENSTNWPNWPNDWAKLCVLIFRMYLTVGSCHVKYALQSESTLSSCLNVKEILARKIRKIWSLSDCNWTRTQNHLVCKRTLNHSAKLTKWLSWVVSIYLYDVSDCIFFSCHVRVSVWIHTL